jgi:hypothetical protein
LVGDIGLRSAMPGKRFAEPADPLMNPRIDFIFPPRDGASPHPL